MPIARPSPLYQAAASLKFPSNELLLTSEFQKQSSYLKRSLPHPRLRKLACEYPEI